MKYLHFIINPVSGKGKHSIDKNLLISYFSKDEYRIETSYTKGKHHAKELAEIAVSNDADCIIACGGDGTINEVASALVGTGKPLGIIPVGSGNGLASNLGIPQDIKKALVVLKQGHYLRIDTGVINGSYFFSNAGLGIDAKIIEVYERKGKHTLWNYITASLSAAFSFKHYRSVIDFNGQSKTVKPFMLMISNSNEMGYGMSLTPKASLNDGFLDMVIIPQLSLLQKMVMGYRVLTKSFLKYKKAEHHQLKSITIIQPDRIYTDVQIDGEYHNIKTNTIHIDIVPQSLKVIA